MSFDNIVNAAAEAEDMTEERASFERTPAREGPALLRLRDYVELGKFANAKNPSWKPAVTCMLTFELLHPEHMLEYDGKKYPDTVTIRINKSNSPKSNFMKLFKAMNYTGTKTHMSQMLGDAFLGTVSHNKVDKTVYVNLNKDGVWSFTAPRVVDPLTSAVTEIPVPELHGEPKLFLWENPGMTDEMIREMWDSVFIDGETDKGKSKNWIQNTISSEDNIEWAGSQTQSAIEGAALDMPANDEALPDEPEQPPFEADKHAKAKAEEVDPLAALGLA